MNSPKVQEAIQRVYEELSAMPRWKFRLLLLKSRLFPGFVGKTLLRLHKDGLWPVEPGGKDDV